MAKMDFNVDITDSVHELVKRFKQSDEFKEAQEAIETLEKARAVLAEHGEAVDWALDKKAISDLAMLPLPKEIKALAALADALGGAGDE